MNMKFSYHILLSVLLLGFASCKSETELGDVLPTDCDPIVLKGIHAVIDNGDGTRAVSPLVDSIGKYSFLNTDEIVFTKIQRTKRPIPGFSYTGVLYSCTVEGTGDKQNVAWKRNNPQDDIFWSDGSEPHTFIGYILPHEDDKTSSASGYDWNPFGDSYYGSIGTPTNASEVIDYTATPVTGAGENKPYDLEKLRKEDLLLSYDTNMQNEDAMAQVHFHHGLASIRVVVTITGFSSTGQDPDAQTLVTDMLVKEQPTLYKWNGNSYKTDPLTADDQGILNGFPWGDGKSAPSWNQKKNMKLWQSRQWRGSGASRSFVFYGIVAPGMQDKVEMEFSVSYPNPLDPNQTERLNKTYQATLDLGNSRKVEFRPGYCTNITINLNHKDEKMSVGAEYMSWQNEPAPNEGTLHKKSTFLTTTHRDSVTIATDENATIDDATWLYVAGKDENGNDIINDIYGNDGSANKPYLIKTADELLSFAYEVNNGRRSFEHQYVKLDADITMQPSRDVVEGNRIKWIGIGNESHKFNGFFLGSERFVNNLYGEPFFYAVGDNAVIDKLNFANIIEVQGCGVIAHKNEGLICGCYIDGDVKETSTTDHFTGSIVGTNESFIIACAHVGKVEGTETVGGLVGFNNGTVMASYHCGKVTGSDPHATVGKRGDGTIEVDGKTTNNSIMFSCYYNADSITHTPTLEPGRSGFPLSTAVMQSNAFVNSLNEFQYDGSGKYTSQGDNLRGVVLAILGDGYQDKTNEELIKVMLSGGVMSENVYKLFDHNFSLNEALRVFRLWLNAIAADAVNHTNDADYKVKTNCHDFSALQILFLQQHYNDQHRFIYTPAAYPKVQ